MADETPFRNTSGQSYVQNYDFTPYASIRTLPVQDQLQQAISAAVYAADPNVQIRVSSGGQSSSRNPSLRNKPGGWTGSDRHNEGGAADFSLVRDGKKLPIIGNEALYQAVTRNLAAQGVPGIGVDTRAGFIHAGGGSEAAWGYEGKSNGARYLPASFATAINEGRAQAKRGGMLVPPGEIPNVVASRTDTAAPRVAPVPATMPPEIAAQRSPQAAPQQYPPPSDRMSEAQVAALYQGIYPQRDLTRAGEIDRSIQTAQAAQDPILAAALQSRSVPRPAPLAPMSREQQRADNNQTRSAPPLMQSTRPSPQMVAASFDRLDDERRPELQGALERSISAASAPVNPILEYNRLRGNPDIASASLAARSAPIPGPTSGFAKDEGRLAPTNWGGIAPMPVKAAAAPINVVAAPPVLQARAPAPVNQPSPLMASFRNVPPPRPRPEMAVSRPAPLMSASQQPVQVVVQGAGSYNSPSTVTGSATGNSYNVGQNYQSAGYNYQFNPDGSVTNTDTGITRGGSRRSYDPDTNSWN